MVILHVVCEMDEKISPEWDNVAFRAIHEWVYGASVGAADAQRVVVERVTAPTRPAGPADTDGS